MGRKNLCLEMRVFCKMKPATNRCTVLSMVIAGLTAVLGVGHANATTYTYAKMNLPFDTSIIAGWSSAASGISGDTVVGYYTDSYSPTKAFVETGGVYTSLTPPGTATEIEAYGVDGNAVVGSYGTSSSTHGFSEIGGVYTTLDVPGARGTRARGISGATVVGEYTGSDYRTHGFSETAGVYTTLDPLGSYETHACGISAGTVVGYYYDGYVLHAFSETSGVYTTLVVPGAVSSQALGISDSTIVGSYRDSNNKWHGFTETGGVYTTLDSPDALLGTFANGISNGTIVGYYLGNSGGDWHAFVATPNAAPEPASLALLALGASSLLVRRRHH